ncbi:hypothetical protein [Propionivibrio sp.]|uniref:hypothetical protein n=1 Tax=Propionivibrio sp. TaxID=2212460 RepID=UPI0025E24133|nr:hypothetical protein [Propionivibrio sp.]
MDLAGREFVCLDTPGHARHHICIVDRRSGYILTGDTFGLSYRELDTDGRQFIFPTSTPSQFEPQVLKESIDLLMTYRPQAKGSDAFQPAGDVDAKRAIRIDRSTPIWTSHGERRMPALNGSPYP